MNGKYAKTIHYLIHFMDTQKPVLIHVNIR